MNFKFSYLLIIALVSSALFISSCNDDMDDGTSSYDCVFVQDDDTDDGFISDAERETMNECYNTRLMTTDGIKNNLIGEWQIIGHGEGWFPKVSQPCSYLTITESEITFEYTDEFTDTLTVHDWNVEKIQTPSWSYYSLNTTPNLWLGLSVFCDQYMYGDATPSDGNMYLFEKVE